MVTIILGFVWKVIQINAEFDGCCELVMVIDTVMQALDCLDPFLTYVPTI